MKPSNITFEKIAIALGQDIQTAKVALAVPPVIEGTLHYRAFCFAELLMERCDRPEALKEQWPEVKRIVSRSKTETTVLIQFNSLPQCFPLVIANDSFTGHPDSIVLKIRRIERNLFYRLKAWHRVTAGGNKKIENINTLVDLIEDNIKAAQYA